MIAIIDYGAGNLTSVKLAFERIGASVTVTSDPDEIANAERVVFPGVGSAGSGMAAFCERGLDLAFRDALANGKPTLAICLGMQMLFESSTEDGGVEALGILPGTVELFEFPVKSHLKVPHMGWNSVSFSQTHPMMAGIRPNEAFYFVHSYFVAATTPCVVIGSTEYGNFEFTSIAGRKNLFATQFHPERSGAAGLQLLKNFLTWDGSLCY
ncbi:MAG: imidazole glycerol phosphate synthase subunit HisH [Victivallaceae bacterium]|nr:imidazole glycerol phosphate synthase subunit HisH [Victivallaceae bacterium]MDD4180125.1 imidazole glycerol phosphate synthase subunit HisH [Victivallaceae bacterium]